MAISRKEIFYWSSVALYGFVLFGVLLFLRFPTEKFRSFCERYVEKIVPDVDCTITKVGYGFPVKFHFEGVEFNNARVKAEVLYKDPLITVSPFWKNPFRTFDIQSTAYEGKHSARLQLNKEAKSIDIRNLEIVDLKLAEIDLFRNRLDRRINGQMDIDGSLKFSQEQFQLIEAEGVISVRGGDFELKRPILSQDSIGLKSSKANFTLRANELELNEGEMKSAKLNTSFSGKVVLTKPFTSGALSIQGDMEPLNPLYQDKRQLRSIVSRMQKRYEQATLPFKVGGTIGRPTFVFEK